MMTSNQDNDGGQLLIVVINYLPAERDEDHKKQHQTVN